MAVEGHGFFVKIEPPDNAIAIACFFKSCLIFRNAKQGYRQFSDDLGFQNRLSQLSDEHLRIAAVGEVGAAAFFG